MWQLIIYQLQQKMRVINKYTFLDKKVILSPPPVTDTHEYPLLRGSLP
jgi:hypothetical protein